MHLTAIPALKFNQIKGLFKVLLIMKIMLLLMLAFVAQAFAAGNAQVVTLSENNTLPKSVLTKIESQTGYYFWYENTLIDKIGPISVKFKKLPLKEALNLCFTDQPVTYEIINRTILLKLKPLDIVFREVTGVVKDSSGNVLAGATITIKGTKKQVISDAGGRFSINAADGDILVISFVGYELKEMLINAGQTEVDIVLQKNTRENENIIITALGIKRQEKALSYNIQRVSGNELTQNKDANFVNSLNGKIAGVTINSSAAGVGGPVRVVMRGIKSLTGNNNALFVIDGIPLQPLTTGQPSDIFGGSTGSDGISGLNPDDIESVSVLTGAAGSALYGSLGLNGVLLVTTKSGAKGTPKLTVSNNTGFFSPFILPKFQNTYGVSSPGSFYSWGEKLKKPSTYNPEDFFQTGYNSSTAMNLSFGSDKSQTYASAAMTKAEGIIPNNKLSRYNFTIRNTTSLFNDKLGLDFNVQYINQSEQNMIAQGLYFNPLVPVYLFPPGDDMSKYQAYERYNPERLLPTQFWPYGEQGSFQMQNPYWIINRNLFPTKKDRFISGVTAKYKLLEGLTATGRVKYDYNVTNNQVKLYASTSGLFSGIGGRYGNTNTVNKQLYSDLILNYDKRFGDFQLNVIAGGSSINQMVNGSGFDGAIAQGSVPNLFTMGNLAIIDPATGRANVILKETNGPRIAMRSLFTTAELGYKNMLFLNGSYRADWWSQLYGSTQNNFQYPSIGASAILSDLFKLRSNVISLIKVRGSYSEVGNTPEPYIANNVILYPVANGQASNNPRYPTPTLSPERSKSVEVGLNVRMLNNKINFDVTLYSTNTFDQIFKVTPSGATGASALYFNAGQVMNKGIEATLGYSGNMGAVGLNSTATFTLNRNKVKKLLRNYYDERTNTKISQDSIIVASTGSYAQFLIEGRPAGDIYVSTLLRDVDRSGNYILDGNDRLVANPNKFVRAGTSSPDYTIGFNNSISYKNINLSFLITARVGGVVVSPTQALMDGLGVSKTSADARDRGYVMVNGKEYTDIEAYYGVLGGGTNGVLSEYVYSASNVRLREISLGYTIPGKLLSQQFIKEINLSLIGQNLFMFYNKAPFDPENTASTATYFQGVDYFMQPSLRSIGFSARIKF